MDPKRFENSSAGRVIQTMRGYHAFIPNPLPPEISFNDIKLIRLISDAERAIGRLAGIGRWVPNPDFLIIPYTRLEAVASSRIEGTQTSLSELFYFEAANERPELTNDIFEVRNYLT